MWQAVSNLIRLIPTLVGELPPVWRRIVILGAFATVFAVTICVALSWRLSSDVPSTVLTGPLSIFLDAKMLALAIAVIMVILSWLGTLIYALYRRN